MFPIRRRLSQVIISVLVLSVFTVLSLNFTFAQTTTPISFGSVTQGNIPTDNAQAMYSFNGNAGDLVSIQALGLSPSWQPVITLFNPAQQLVASSADSEPLGFMISGAQIVYRLQQTGAYTILVSGTAGDFLLTLGGRLALTSTPLVLNTPLNLSLPAAEPASVFVFNTDPIFATTLLIDADPVDLNANIEIRNAVGQVVSSLHGNLDNACISFGPGDEVDEMTITANPAATGTVSITLSNAPCQLGAAAQPQPAPVQFVPVPIEGVCAASSFRNVNIRSGPSTAFSIISTLPSRQPIQVMGRNDDGSWYAVQSTFVQGWISAGVVSVTGPCDGLPVVPPPALPAASPTPGLPVVTVVVTATDLTASPTVDPSVPTATASPATETVVPTETAPDPTPEVTPTVTPG